MNLRLHGTPAECETAARRLTEVFDVVSIRGPYPDRGRSVLVRVYVEFCLDLPTESSASRGRRDQPSQSGRELP